MHARFFLPLVFGAVVLICGFSADAQQPERNPQPRVMSPFRLQTPAPRPLVPPQPGVPSGEIKSLSAQPQTPPPTFRWDQRAPFGTPPPREGVPFHAQPAPGTPQPNPWDLFRLLIPDPEAEAGTWQPNDSRVTPSPQTPRRPPEPSAEQIARLTNGQLATLLNVAAGTLSIGLDRLNTGDHWKKYLELQMLQREFADDARGQLDPLVADGMKRTDWTIADGIKRGNLTLAAGVKRGDLASVVGIKFGDLTVADGTKLADLTLAEGMNRGDLTLEEGLKVADLGDALGVAKPGDMTLAEAIKHSNLTVSLDVKRPGRDLQEKLRPEADPRRPGDRPELKGRPEPEPREELRPETDRRRPGGMFGRRRPDPDKREQLAKVAKRFEEVAENPEYKKIASIRGFQTLRRGLHEYTLPPAERQAHVLEARLPILTAALDRLRGGAAWKEFLSLEELEQLLDSVDELQSEDRDTLVEILQRFEKIRQDPQYAVVARTRGFEVTYEALKALVESLEEESVGSLPPPPQ